MRKHGQGRHYNNEESKYGQGRHYQQQKTFYYSLAATPRQRGVPAGDTAGPPLQLERMQQNRLHRNHMRSVPPALLLNVWRLCKCAGKYMLLTFYGEYMLQTFY